MKRVHILAVVCMYISYSNCCRSVMNLTRGEGGKCPCPVCYVLQNEQGDLTKTHEPQTAMATQQICHLASIQTTQAAHEEILKAKGIWMLEVTIPSELHDLTLTQPRTHSGPLNFRIHMLLLHSIICIITHMVWVVNIFGLNFSDMLTIFVGKR